MAPYRIEHSEDEKIMMFAGCCIEWVAERLGCDYQEVFSRLDRFGLIEDLIIGCYPALHTQSRQHVTEDIITALEIRENAAL
ncbi:MAG: DUF3791 domain-containing protein [Muribaculaceae bacterium]|nr:DUF3791 domain-containing protein [Muribaculaceae bacterium]